MIRLLPRRGAGPGPHRGRCRRGHARARADRGRAPAVRRPGRRPAGGRRRPQADHHREQRGRLHRLRNAGRNDSGKRRRRARRLRQPASGDEQCSACTLRLRARSPVASGSPGPVWPSLPCRRPARPQSRSAVLPMPASPRPTSILLSSSRAAASTYSSASGPGLDGRAYGVDVNSAVSFSVLPAIAHVSIRVAPAASQLRLPASRKSASQPGRHALSARAAMTPCPVGAQVRRRAIPPRRDCSHRSVADRRNSSGRTSSPQRCMSSGPSGTPVSFGA